MKQITINKYFNKIELEIFNVIKLQSNNNGSII
jgi:hypothetical protein